MVLYLSMGVREQAGRHTHQGLREAIRSSLHIDKFLPTSMVSKDSQPHRGAVGIVGGVSPWNFTLHHGNS